MPPMLFAPNVRSVKVVLVANSVAIYFMRLKRDERRLRQWARLVAPGFRLLALSLPGLSVERVHRSNLEQNDVVNDFKLFLFSLFRNLDRVVLPTSLKFSPQGSLCPSEPRRSLE
jgi:hypothetical protein